MVTPILTLLPKHTDKKQPNPLAFWECVYIIDVYKLIVFDQADVGYYIIGQIMGGSALKITPTSNSNILDELLSEENKSKQTISNLLARFTAMIKFEKETTFSNSQQYMELTQSMVALYWHENFPTGALFWYKYMKNYLTKLLIKKSMMFVTTDQWRLCLGLAQFVMLCCDQNIREFLNKSQYLKFVYKDEQTSNYTEKRYNKPQQNLQSVENGLTEIEKQQARDKLRQFIYYSLYAKNKIVPHFSVSFTQINRTLECVLNLFLKLQYESPSLTPVGLKRNITICAYVIGLGLEYDHVQMIHLAVKFLLSVLNKAKTEPEILTQLQLNPIPTQYFKQIPVFTCSTLYQTIFTYLLHALSVKTADVEILEVVELLETVMSISRPKNKQIIPLFEKICQLKVFTQNQQVKLKTIMRKYFKSLPMQSKQIKQFINKAHSLKEILSIEELDNESSLTEGYKHQSQSKSELPLSEVDSGKYTLLSMSTIYQMYHLNVSMRFMPSINASYKFDKQQDVEIRLPLRMKADTVVPSEKTSKKGSEEQSLQAFNEEKNQKGSKNFRIQEIQ